MHRPSDDNALEELQCLGPWMVYSGCAGQRLLPKTHINIVNLKLKAWDRCCLLLLGKFETTLPSDRPAISTGQGSQLLRIATLPHSRLQMIRMYCWTAHLHYVCTFLLQARLVKRCSQDRQRFRYCPITSCSTDNLTSQVFERV